MALKEYEWNGSTYQFDPKEAPADAVEVKSSKPANKAVTAENKGGADDGGKPASSRQR